MFTFWNGRLLQHLIPQFKTVYIDFTFVHVVMFHVGGFWQEKDTETKKQNQFTEILNWLEQVLYKILIGQPDFQNESNW